MVGPELLGVAQKNLIIQIFQFISMLGTDSLAEREYSTGPLGFYTRLCSPAAHTI